MQVIDDCATGQTHPDAKGSFTITSRLAEKADVVDPTIAVHVCPCPSDAPIGTYPENRFGAVTRRVGNASALDAKARVLGAAEAERRGDHKEEQPLA